ncbi:uncharacterized protein LOC143018238 [Oratosquilla oratoria]|uniref:uncharacterized protein LOC143018238 n=1 Tax=Oratosquilla oratoria TaxID=337810 RepID=UPI003F75E0B8
MILGLNSGTRVALFLMWLTCLVTVLHMSDAKVPRAKDRIECINGTDCPSDLKCCGRYCRSSCKKPNRRGCRCPRIKPGQVGICIEQCANGLGCGEGTKCCFNGCGHVCYRLPEHCRGNNPSPEDSS